MKQTKILMGMPITVEIADKSATEVSIQRAFDYFAYVEEKFSVYRKDSEISRINQGKIQEAEFSNEMREVFDLSEKTRKETDGYFNILKADGKYDPSGTVKGWAIYNAAKLLKKDGFKNFFVDAGGDIQAYGNNEKGEKWSVGIRNPFNIKEIVKVVLMSNKGVATSGTQVRGQHVYNPKLPGKAITDIVSLTVIGPNIYEADRFATAVFAMGKKGIIFIENLEGFEGYMIDKDGVATYTSGFERFVK